MSESEASMSALGGPTEEPNESVSNSQTHGPPEGKDNEEVEDGRLPETESSPKLQSEKGRDEDVADPIRNTKRMNSAEANKTEHDDTTSESQALPTAAPAAGDWQAIWSPAHQAYYFYNARTGETTWTNPLQSDSSNSTAVAGSSSAIPSDFSMSTTGSLYAAAEAAGIDPSLAHLDPSLGMPGSAPVGTFAAKFNARTGAFTRMDARDPSHLSEAERAKRMSAVYFDVGAWEQEVEQRVQEEDATGKKRKRPTKKDLERFKEQKKQKKIAKTAWLRT